jgi:hypothetical protein
MRTRARSSADAGRIGFCGYLSSRYSQMIVESKILVGPSMSAGTSARGFASVHSDSAPPVPIAGVFSSKGIPFSSRKIFTF